MVQGGNIPATQGLEPVGQHGRNPLMLDSIGDNIPVSQTGRLCLVLRLVPCCCSLDSAPKCRSQDSKEFSGL